MSDWLVRCFNVDTISFPFLALSPYDGLGGTRARRDEENPCRKWRRRPTAGTEQRLGRRTDRVRDAAERHARDRDATQMIAEVGAEAAAFESAKELSSWVGVCPGDEETAGKSKSTRSPKGNSTMRRLLNQAAQSAVKVKGSIFEIKFRKLLPRLGYQQAIWAIAHRLCRLLWMIVHAGIRYEERGPAVSAKSLRSRTARMIKALQKLGYRVEAGPLPAGSLA